MYRWQHCQNDPCSHKFNENDKNAVLCPYVHITTVNNVLYMQCTHHSVYTVKYDFSKIIGIDLQ